MFPEIHFNFDALALDRVYQYFVPFLPGLILTGGVALMRPGLFLRVPIAGSYISLVVLAVVSYVVGLVLLGISVIIAGTALAAMSSLSGRQSKGRNNLALSQRTNWRRIAAKFLGPELTPSAPTPEPTSTLEQQIGALSTAMKSAQYYDLQWKEWYDILQEFLLRDVPVVSLDKMMLALGLQSTGWALVGFSSVVPDAQTWVIHATAGLLIVFGVLIPWGAVNSYVHSDRLGYWDFTARLLAEIRAREAPRISPIPSPETDTKR